MSRDKQIEEMAKNLAKSIEWRDLYDDELTVDTVATAKTLYAKGYRKASDVIEETEKYFNDRVRGGYIGGVSVIFAELKKKYESEGEG